jgi:hypothetical protein
MVMIDFKPRIVIIYAEEGEKKTMSGQSVLGPHGKEALANM